MRHFLLVLLVVGIVLGEIFALVWTNTSIDAGFTLKKNEEKLTELANTNQTLQARHLKILFAYVELRARDDGFIAVVSPRYLTDDTAVSLRR